MDGQLKEGVQEGRWFGFGWVRDMIWVRRGWDTQGIVWDRLLVKHLQWIFEEAAVIDDRRMLELYCHVVRYLSIFIRNGCQTELVPKGLW